MLHLGSSIRFISYQLIMVEVQKNVNRILMCIHYICFLPRSAGHMRLPAIFWGLWLSKSEMVTGCHRCFFIFFRMVVLVDIQSMRAEPGLEIISLLRCGGGDLPQRVTASQLGPLGYSQLIVWEYLHWDPAPEG
jgi:hypothetical protein